MHDAEHELRRIDGCALTLEYSDRVTYAMRQQGTPLVESVTIANTSDQALPEGELRLSLESGECEAWSRAISPIAPKSAIRVVPDGWALLPERLGERTEAERTTIHATYVSGAGRCSVSGDLDVLAFDQWPGVLHHPETTAAFVTPNHSLIAELLGHSREILRERGDSGSLDGYQSGSRQRVARLAEACTLAVCARDIGYIQPPASFEKLGQRVRLVDRILRERLGTCLDLSLLLLGLWEQCGLHGLLLLPEKHALPAFWTRETRLPELVVDDAARIRNLIDLGEIVPVESTLLTSGERDFEAMVASARERLESPGESFLAIDIASARKRGVRPLPLRDEAGLEAQRASSGVEASPGSPTALDSVLMAERADRAVSETEQASQGEAGRIENWQSRLLDLSLRNRLLNYRNTGRTIELEIPDLALFEDRLSDEQGFEILPRIEGNAEYLREELESGRVYATETDAETQKRLLTIYRLARSSVEETGANLLHLALGQLAWYETEVAERERVAPLILLPVELKRSSSGSGYAYTLRLLSEPIRPNVTLLEKLRTEYGIDTSRLEELPEDERGVDVQMVLRGFREAIRGAKRWEVRESASLGLFSFNKFLMWRDLRENLEQLKENRLVRHLVTTPGEAFDPEPFPDPALLDETLGPGDLYCTRDADSSQMRAIVAASRGRSFVLEGPPGTGKSQTIANMIANSLGQGKRVLFVAEKMAALSVVRKRLEQDGLGAHCLELHSSKASKKEVLAQLARSLEHRAAGVPADWERVCDELDATRDALNTYVRELHEPRASGETLYEVIGRISLPGERATLALEVGDVASTTADELRGWRELIQGLVERSISVDPVYAHPLRGVGLNSWSFGIEESIQAALAPAIEQAGRVSLAARDLLRELPGEMGAHAPGRADFEFLARLAPMMATFPVPARSLIDGAESGALRERLWGIVALGRERDTIQSKILERYEREFLGLSHLELIDQAERASAQIALFRWFRHKLIARKLRAYAKERVPGLEVLLADLRNARRVHELDAQIKEAQPLIDKALGTAADASQSWDHIERSLVWADEYVQAVQTARSDGADPGLLRSALELVIEKDAVSRTTASFETFKNAWNEWLPLWERVVEVLAVDVASIGSEEGASHLESLAEAMRRWRDSLGELSAWCVWREARDAAMTVSTRAIVRAYEEGCIERDSLEDVFEQSYGEQWFVSVANGVEAIRGFNADLHENRIDRFRELDRAMIERTKYVVGSLIDARTPTIPEEASSKSEVGVLRREIEKKRRHMPTRRLLETIPGLAGRLKPCFLMSPLSVAQYLSDGLAKFDVVIFDEASQIPVWDAVGAIARGHEVIVVGDSKQLPPTTFFDAMGMEDEVLEVDGVEDVESVLKECNAAGVPAIRLSWHYRSRHESLIAFSNRQYYGNELHTFPSPVERSPELGVSFHFVENAVYDRGGSRTNRVEAEAVVERVVRMLREPGANGSIGIVTFNQAQQMLIEDLLDAQRREDPALDAFFGDHLDEGVFVKNLENVQGDERDTIIFSIGYGPDEDGRVSMNFGPLNKEGGERRLNVAITRAKKRLLVFSSITSDAIDLRRTGAEGVRDFRHFLDYAEHGVLTAGPDDERALERASQCAFVRAVGSALESHGYAVDTDVGYAGYRIDLGVRDQEREGRYLLGIECDGRTYAQAHTARDRDRTRNAVLKGLGWSLHRVWSVQWRINRERCIASMLAALESAAAGDADRRAERQGSETELVPHVEAPHRDAGQALDGTVVTPYVVSKRPGRGRVRDESDPRDRSRLLEWIQEIVRVEQPIVHELVIRRLASWCERQQTTARFREIANELVDELLFRGVLSRERDAYRMRDSAERSLVRSPGKDASSRRDPEMIPEVEIDRAIEHVLATQFGMPRDELCREAGRVLGFSRIVGRIQARLTEGVERLMSSEVISDDDGVMRLERRD